METLDENLITFGKFKNKHLKDLLRDRKYCLWLLNQDWFPQYEYIYNNVKNFDPKLFIYPECIIPISELTQETFVEKYTYFNLKKPCEKTFENETDKVCYIFYLEVVNDLKKKIKARVAKEDSNPFDIKAPSKWLQSFETDTKLNREIFKEFISAFELPNITSIVEEIKAFGGVEYSGAKTYKIGKKRSETQEKYWETILKTKHGEKISSQFKYMNCFFDFININTQTLYECKLAIKDFNESQYTKYQLVTDNMYNILYLIGTDCIIDMNMEAIYTTNLKEYILYQVNIPLLKNPSKFDDLIFDFDIYEVDNFNDVI